MLIRISCQVFGCAGLIVSVIGLLQAFTGPEGGVANAVLIFASGGMLWCLAAIAELLYKKP